MQLYISHPCIRHLDILKFYPKQYIASRVHVEFPGHIWFLTVYLFNIFQNARIVLDEFQIILHSPDSIAPVGVLHPLTFHLEDKLLGDHEKINNLNHKKISLVHEVQDDHLEECKDPNEYVAAVTELTEVTEDRLKISMTERSRTFSVTCWLQETCQVSSGRFKMKLFSFPLKSCKFLE